MQDYSIFPVINASLNGTAAVLIGTGVYLIKTGRERAHKAVMVLAISTSTLFLISYLYYHAHIGSYHFRGHGWARPLYFTILTTHTILAAVIVPLVIITVTRAWRGQLRPPPCNRPLDVPALAVRLHHRRSRLFHALQDLRQLEQRLCVFNPSGSEDSVIPSEGVRPSRGSPTVPTQTMKRTGFSDKASL